MAAYAINGKDLESTYGIQVMSGSDDLLKQPKPKKYYQHDWGGEDGVEIDPSEPVVYESRKVEMEYVLIAANETDFWNKYGAFLQEISKPGMQKWYVSEIQKNYLLKIDNTGNFRRFTRLRGEQDKVVVRFSIGYIEPNPEGYTAPTPAPTPGTGVQIDWGYSSSPIYDTNYSALTFQFTAQKSENSPELNFTQAANFKYLVIRTASTVKSYINWFNTNFNQGKFPDQVFYPSVESGGFRYYISRTEVLLDKDNSSIKLS